jgi:hypothetical protein
MLSVFLQKTFWSSDYLKLIAITFRAVHDVFRVQSADPLEVEAGKNCLASVWTPAEAFTWSIQ